MNKHPFRLTPVQILLSAITFVLLVGLACNQPSNGTTENVSPNLTQVALDVQSTLNAKQAIQNQEMTQSALEQQQANLDAQSQQMTQSAFDQQQAEINAQNTQAAQNATLSAQQATQIVQTAQAQAQIQQTQASQNNQGNQQSVPTITPEPPQPDIEEQIRNSKILVYEDITKEYLPRYVKEALDGMGLSSNYTDVKDAMGNFKTELLSGTQWDLVIASSEARTNVQGEFFVYLNDLLNNGSAVIIEHWNLDDLSAGKASLILTKCGIKISGDWSNPPNNARSIWFLQGQNPIFHEPNEGMSLANYSIYWYGDVGDLMKKYSGSDAVLLAGIYAQEKNNYATLASCLDGRLIIQTFSSHDYHHEDMVRLWQNYIYNSLKAHYEYINNK